MRFERQYNLFSNNDIDFLSENTLEDIPMNKKIIQEWQKKIIIHQSTIFKCNHKDVNQTSLFESSQEELSNIFNPIELTPLSLNFWKWPKTMHQGPAIYFVMDKIINCNESIILYIGETISAENRWKGAHDCKSYLSSYSESLQKANIKSRLNIRFWLDVPSNTKERRKLEKKFIQTWLPPFNKETRGIWATPFTSQIK
tara:strand:- start:401 stop:997 length:597 start_codon:yes stop_codon:yes gene_type:complete